MKYVCFFSSENDTYIQVRLLLEEVLDRCSMEPDFGEVSQSFLFNRSSECDVNMLCAICIKIRIFCSWGLF